MSVPELLARLVPDLGALLPAAIVTTGALAIRALELIGALRARGARRDDVGSLAGPRPPVPTVDITAPLVLAVALGGAALLGRIGPESAPAGADQLALIATFALLVHALVPATLELLHADAAGRRRDREGETFVTVLALAAASIAVAAPAGRTSTVALIGLATILAELARPPGRATPPARLLPWSLVALVTTLFLTAHALEGDPRAVAGSPSAAALSAGARAGFALHLAAALGIVGAAPVGLVAERSGRWPSAATSPAMTATARIVVSVSLVRWLIPDGAAGARDVAAPVLATLGILTAARAAIAAAASIGRSRPSRAGEGIEAAFTALGAATLASGGDAETRATAAGALILHALLAGAGDLARDVSSRRRDRSALPLRAMAAGAPPFALFAGRAALVWAAFASSLALGVVLLVVIAAAACAAWMLAPDVGDRRRSAHDEAAVASGAVSAVDGGIALVSFAGGVVAIPLLDWLREVVRDLA